MAPIPGRLTAALASFFLLAGLWLQAPPPVMAARPDSSTVGGRPTFEDLLRSAVPSGLLPAARTLSPQTADTSWSGQFGLSELGATWDVYALLVHDGDLVVAGGFTFAGGIPVHGIARWDGSSWSAMGSGMDGPVYALAEFDGALIAGGDFLTAGGTPASRIARWDGAGWSALSPEVTYFGPVYAFALYEGDLIAGGGFDEIGGIYAGGIARWDGEHWAALSGAGSDATVRSLLVHDGDLFAGGSFTTMDRLAVNGVARWDGAAWHALGAGMGASTYTPEVYALTAFGGDLIAAGAFTAAGGLPAANVARWDGAAWHALGAGLDIGARSAWALNGALFLGGAFTTAGGTPARHIARWSGTAWSAVGGGTDSRVLALGTFDGALIAGGWFTEAGGTQVNRIARWDGAQWTGLGTATGHGMDHDVSCFAVYRGELIAGGSFLTAGGIPAYGIARWDGTRWRYMGPFEAAGGRVDALVVWGDYLVAGGGFTAIGGLPASAIAKWDGMGWSAVSATGANGAVYALAVHDGDLIAAGRFTAVNGVPANRIARWDGVAWHPLGSGVTSSQTEAEVYGLASYDEELVAVGSFEAAGGVACNHAARWNGSIWQALGSGFNDGARAAGVYGDALFVGGAFTASGSTALNHIARWDGGAWQALGSGVDGRVTSLAVQYGRLFAGGWFTQAGGAPASHIASWDGFEWEALGSGANDDVLALADYGGLLYAGGAFTTAGLKPSLFVGSWAGKPPIAVRLLSFTAARTEEGALLRWRIADASDHAGFHVHREDSQGERVRLTESLLTGGPGFAFADPAPPAEGARYWLAEWSRSGEATWHGPATLDPIEPAALRVALAAARPNPFRAATQVRYTLPVGGIAALGVYDAAGRLVATLRSGFIPAGRHEARWDGLAEDGARAAAGVYFLRLTTPAGSASRRIVLAR